MANRIAAAAVTAVALLGAGATATYADGADLYSRLAPAPGANWVERVSSPTTLEGPFDSHSYDTYLQAVSPRTQRVEQQLNALAFRGGYSRMWVQGTSQDVLVERVFQFGDALGAQAWYENLKTQNQFTKYMVKVIPPLDGHPDSFGVVLRTPDYVSYRVEFVVGNLVFTVHMDSAQNDLTVAAIGQALAELKTQVAAPVRPVPAPSPPLPLLAGALLAIAATGFAAQFWRRRGVRRL